MHPASLRSPILVVLALAQLVLAPLTASRGCGSLGSGGGVCCCAAPVALDEPATELSCCTGEAAPRREAPRPCASAIGSPSPLEVPGPVGDGCACRALPGSPPALPPLNGGSAHEFQVPASALDPRAAWCGAAAGWARCAPPVPARRARPPGHARPLHLTLQVFRI